MLLERTNSTAALAKIYTSSDLFINLTYEDTYPTVNLEAQACGIPAATYQTDGSVESVEKCMIVEQGNLNKIRELIENMCTNKRYHENE